MIRRSANMDRRSGVDRRKAHKLDYFLNGGVERRSFKERRSNKERRQGWVRVSEWTSLRLESLQAGKTPKKPLMPLREKK